jgi:DNA helicase-4
LTDSPPALSGAGSGATLLGSGRGWSVETTPEGLTVRSGSEAHVLGGTAIAELRLQRKWFRWRLYQGANELAALRGLNAAGAENLRCALALLVLQPALDHATEWARAVQAAIAEAKATGRWVPREVLDALERARPRHDLIQRVTAAGLWTRLSLHSTEALRMAVADLPALFSVANEEILTAEMAAQADFLASIETQPLTTEQQRAVLCLDNRVQLVAAAGSGKTSVMVARAAYAVRRGFITPERILLLAFNRAAADELQDRITRRFEAAGLDPSGVRASTFHSFGLDVIGKATGKKPRLARWLDTGDDVKVVEEIVASLRASSPQFAYDWDLYRLLFANTSPDQSSAAPDGYDSAERRSGYVTMGGDTVRSVGERMIADFLYLNHVAYEYERPYVIDVADQERSQYRPDFYYPDIDAWHEHWALDRDGRPPASFLGYAEAMAWKKALHHRHRTTLIETTWSDVLHGGGLKRLQAQLIDLGLELRWDPDRTPKSRWAQPTSNQALARLMRTFMTHVKSNGWSRSDVDGRLAADPGPLQGYRSQLFLGLYWQVHDEWQRRLAADQSIDFEDMLVEAAGHLESGAAAFDYQMILVDELQDTSRARARLVRGLLRDTDRYLLAVGDDWQSVNRFAGADLSIMKGFFEWFGPGPRLDLTATFRCPQVICDVSSSFVSKNPSQLTKPMRAVRQGAFPPVRVVLHDDYPSAVASELERLSATRAGDGGASVFVLGRYRFQRDAVPRQVPKGMSVSYRTVHAAKGLEADYVIVVGLDASRHGFPSNVADDPVLALAMPQPEEFEHAEERRLLYVALTRARHGVTLVAPTGRPSPFVIELLNHPNVVQEAAIAGTGTPSALVELCRSCGRGTLRKREGKYGAFYGCSTFPACRYTRDAGDGTVPSPRRPAVRRSNRRRPQQPRRRR